MKPLSAAAFAALLCVAAGCSHPMSPTGPAEIVAARPPAAPPSECSGSARFGAVTAPARVYESLASCPYPSRFVLYDDGRFELEYIGLAPYGGTYHVGPDGGLAFDWDGTSLAGPWGASGVVTDDSLSVTFNIIMQLSDFEDATYDRVR